jgi:hypothetical protein
MTARLKTLRRRELRADFLRPDDFERRLNAIVARSTAKVVERVKAIVKPDGNGLKEPEPH